MSSSTMDCWDADGEGTLVRLEPDSTCDGDDGGVIHVLLDGTGTIERIWRDDERVEAGLIVSTTHEVEDSTFVSLLIERFPSGRTNYDREVELDDLSPLSHRRRPDESELRRQLRRYLRHESADA
ncbi:MAG: hypothetical protein KDB53_12830 [Planctomycetes bacterium]|nr:hypothetical protein [Planctomycetota bacterium]